MFYESTSKKGFACDDWFGRYWVMVPKVKQQMA